MLQSFVVKRCPPTSYINNPELLHLAIVATKNGVDSGTLKKEMLKHRVVFDAHDAPE